ncbi:MAG: hypothetical protein BWY17_02012 [Deltaproteobacteria bacterium ADurb.Bin207]|jgi:hypothetical protein|nr:MAG: hypothetical protein BWY17_02012 [Deltaproteobacteria bacterium ADurb.Bin207]
MKEASAFVLVSGARFYGILFGINTVLGDG